MRKVLVSAALVTASLFAASSASAADFDPWFATSRVGGYLELWPTDNFFTTTFGVEMQFRLSQHAYLDASFSGAYFNYDDGFNKYDHGAFGNPTIGAHYAGQATPRLAFFIGGGLTVPLLNDPDGDVALAAYQAAPLRAYYDADRFVPGGLALRAAGGIEWRASQHFFLRAEVRPVVYVPTRDRFNVGGVNFTRNDPDVFIEQAIEGEYRFNNGFGFGARLQAVALLTSNGDQIQVAAEPFIGLTPSRRGFFFRLGFMTALDEPLGFAFDDGKLAAVRLLLGGQF